MSNFLARKSVAVASSPGRLTDTGRTRSRRVWRGDGISEKYYTISTASTGNISCVINIICECAPMNARAPGKTAVSVSLPQSLVDQIDARAAGLGLNRSQYLASLARCDIHTGGPLELRDAPSSTARDLVDAAAAAAVQRAAAGKPVAAPVRYKLTPAPRRKDSRKRAATSGNP